MRRPASTFRKTHKPASDLYPKNMKVEGRVDMSSATHLLPPYDPSIGVFPLRVQAEMSEEGYGLIYIT